ncbi:DNA modification methylase [Nitrobacter vulgaris]|jgi:DNA modification methylase|uniref:hypothetical protein n=1 Tax=Nitrobacter vulgaris TaxID=29421 RepID=UPI0028581332|nr:hypothetical protein [Nitrobacter vulgaris]MDR6304963.1 DNA modification methylase [Nitrobacter vulgaris]
MLSPRAGRHGRYRTNVWSYAGVNSFGNDRSDLALHPTVKPVALVADAMIATEQTGRRGYGIEIDPLYRDVIIRSLRIAGRLEAILESAGKSFQQIQVKTL